jgi:hypothetical protein
MTYIYAIETNGTVGDIMYFDFNKPQITQEDSVKLFRSQFPIVPPIIIHGPTKSTKKQFAAEQAVIKALKKKAEQEQVRRTPRKKSGTSKANAS